MEGIFSLQKQQDLNSQVAQILKSQVSPLDSDGIAHYFVDPQDIWNVTVPSHHQWQESTFHQKLVIDIDPEEKSIALSYCNNDNKSSFTVTHFKVDAIFVYENKEQDLSEYEIIFETSDLGRNSVMVELEPHLNVTIGIFHNKEVFPDLITKKWPVTFTI